MTNDDFKSTWGKKFHDMSREEQTKLVRGAEKRFDVDLMGEMARDACIAEQLGIESHEYLEWLMANDPA